MSIFSGDHDSGQDYIYHALPRSYQEDLVSGVYRIHINRPVTELSNQFCRYYFATHTGTEKEYFAIVFERSFNVSIKELHLLTTLHCPSLNNLIAYSLVRLATSKKYLICAIVDAYNPEETLRRYIETNGPMKDDYVEDKLMPAMVSLLEFCDTHNINCNNIHPDNVIISKDGTIKLREFVNALPHFYQHPSFLAPEIADALPFGRKVFGVGADIYAFSILIYYAMTGEIPDFSKHEPKLYNAARIEAGSYNLTAAQKRLPQKFKLLLAWTMQDMLEARWGVERLIAWGSSRASTKMPKAKSSNSYTTLFNGHNYSNPVALASAITAFYDDGLTFCRTEGFLKWVQKTKGRAEVVEYFMHVQHDKTFGTLDGEMQESFLKIIAMLDPNSPIRLKDFCITTTSFQNVLFYSINKSSSALLNTVITILKHSYWHIMISDGSANIPKEYSGLLSKVSSMLMSDSDCIERISYDLDMYLPCMSPVISSDYALSISDLLVSLDKVAAHTPGKLNIDHHIVSFVESRLSAEDIKSRETRFTNIGDSTLIKAISLLAIVQEQVPEIKIPHLCSVAAQKLIEWANDNLHNAKLKHVITSELAELAGSGMLSQMLYVVSNPKLFQNDNKGYKVAYKQMLDLTKTIKRLSDSEEVYNIGLGLGQRVTVLLGYILCMVVALILVV